MTQDATFTLRISQEELDTFAKAVHDTDPEVSVAHAFRELARWYAGGCGGKLRLEIPLRYPSPSGTV